MALKKSKTLANGTSGEYWKIISEVYERTPTRSVTWRIALFLNQASAGNKHLGLVKQFSANITAQEAAGNRTELGYQKIKALAATPVTHDLQGQLLDTPTVRDPDLSGAEDV